MKRRRFFGLLAAPLAGKAAASSLTETERLPQVEERIKQEAAPEGYIGQDSNGWALLLKKKHAQLVEMAEKHRLKKP